MLSNLDDSDSEADNGDSESDEKEVVATEAVVTEAAVDPGEDAASEVKSVGESEAVTSLEEGRPQSCPRPRRASLATSRPNDGKIFFSVDVRSIELSITNFDFTENFEPCVDFCTFSLDQ
jgi:hypothetical protein